MREVDFLPTWYKEKRRYQCRIWYQCVVLAIVFLMMIVWNSLATRAISQASTQLSAQETHRLYAQRTSRQFDDYCARIKSLQEQLTFVEALDSHLDVPSLLAELSHLISERVVLSYMQGVAESFDQTDAPPAVPSDDGTAAFSHRPYLPIDYVRFRIVLGGLALDASEVASLIHELEQSPYFRQVILVFSRDAKAFVEPNAQGVPGAHGTAGDTDGNTEFEISCYLANYQEPEIED
jgi:hypothetical protein